MESERFTAHGPDHLGRPGMTTRHILIVVHDYPPILSAGAERLRSFARYLPDFGFEPLILTTGRYGGLPDDAQRQIFRAGDLIHGMFGVLRRRKTTGLAQEAQFRVATIPNQSLPGRVRDAVLIPDTKLGWLLPAVRLGHSLIERYRPAAMLSSSPPETAHLVAARLNRTARIPWIADLRDGWLYEPPNPTLRRPRIRHALEAYLERGVVTAASALVTATLPITDDLRARYPGAAAKVTTITNGFDAAEFAGLARRRVPDGTFRLVYTGSLANSRQGTSADAFFEGVSQLLSAQPQARLEIQVVGDTGPHEQAAARTWGLSARVSFLSPVPRRVAHEYQLNADALLLITAPGPRSVATLKLFDYIGAGVPILALARDNAAASIVQAYQLGITVAPDDPRAIAQALGDLMVRQARGDAWPGFAAAQQVFERRTLTGQLAVLLESLLARDS